ncbi:MAG: hypothetical protein CM15mP74_14330 [Halieaceae bacterium]|nr:MAG: hypothetical protein CM15mP74_14330 [Halieaceae bacterium]
MLPCHGLPTDLDGFIYWRHGASGDGQLAGLWAIRRCATGPEGEPPEYSTSSWIAMMFTASMGAGLIAWGFAEPVFYIETPPFGIGPTATSPTSSPICIPLPLGHRALGDLLPARIPIAYMLFVDNRKSLKISDACDHVLPERGNPRSGQRSIYLSFWASSVVSPPLLASACH